MSKNIFPESEMAKSHLNCYELPMDLDLFDHYKHIFGRLPFWDYKFAFAKEKSKFYRSCFIRYIDWSYSPNLSCIEIRYPEERERKMAIGQISGFPINAKGNFEHPVDQILKGQNEYTNQMILSFLKILGSDEWSTMKWLRDQHYKNMLDNDKAKDGLEQQRIIDALSKLKKMKGEFLKGDTSYQLNISMIQRMEAENLNLGPEAIGANIEKGLSPLGFTIAS